MQVEISTKGIVYPITTKKTVRDRLPGMNDIIDISKLGRGKYQPYNQMKAYFEMFLYSHLNKLPGFGTISLRIDWYMPNAKMDIDNIQAGTKFIMDTLKKTSVIVDDSQRYVKSINHNFYVDKDNPRIVLNIEEVK